MQCKMAKDAFVRVLATSDNNSIAIARMASDVRHGHDNLSADIFKLMLQFSSQRAADPIVGKFLTFYANCLNNVFTQPVCAKQVTEFFDSGEIFGL